MKKLINELRLPSLEISLRRNLQLEKAFQMPLHFHPFSSFLEVEYSGLDEPNQVSIKRLTHELEQPYLGIGWKHNH